MQGIPDRYQRVLFLVSLAIQKLTNGRSSRTLNILDDFKREVVNIVVDISISSTRVARELTNRSNIKSIDYTRFGSSGGYNGSFVLDGNGRFGFLRMFESTVCKFCTPVCDCKTLLGHACNETSSKIPTDDALQQDA
jgi:hypothetical protein